MTADSERRKALFETIDQEASDPQENQDSKVLFDTLRERREALGGASALPEDDPQLNESIRQAATRRSRELRGSTGGRRSTAVLVGMKPSEPIPAWLWLAWAVAILAAGFLLFWLW
jgi:hypothetical protein